MKIKDCKGKLIVVDMYSCKEAAISDAAVVKQELEKACADFSMELVQLVVSENDEQKECSLVALCKSGHVTLHIYKELGFVTADVFSCNENAKPAELSRYLRIFFGTDKAKITLLDRGDFGSETDMKPRRNSKIKIGRHTRSIGNKLKKMILKPRSI